VNSSRKGVGSHLLRYAFLGAPVSKLRPAPLRFKAYKVRVQHLLTRLNFVPMPSNIFDFGSLQPYLTFREELTDPQAVIQEFFRQFHLQDVQEVFWDICKAALSSSSFETPKQRADLLFVAEMIMPFFAAVEMLHIANKNKKGKETVSVSPKANAKRKKK
jgi:hypothetical protein